MNELATSYGQRKAGQLKTVLKKGAKLVVFDPRKSETAAKATEWIPLKPGTDGAVAMAMCHVIIREGLYDEGFVREWTTGFEAFRARVMGEEDGQPRTPEWAETISGVSAPTIERIAREFAGAANKGALSWTGLAQVPNGMHATAAIQALNGLCGTFDAPGGPSLPFKRKLNSPWGPEQEKPPKAAAPKLDAFEMWAGWAPALALRDVKAGKLKGMIIYYGDPVLSWGNQEATTEAIQRLDVKVAIDAFMSNTALLCDVVLPDATWLEQSQVKPDWLYEAFISYFAQIVQPMYDAKPMWEITVLLARKLGLGHYFPWEDVEEAFRNQMAGTPWAFEELKAKGFIITDEAEYYKYKKWGGINPPEGYGSSGMSKTGKYNFLNPVAAEKGVDPLPDYKVPDEDLRPDASYPFLFGNFRLLQHEHCSTFNNFQLMKLKGVNPLWVNDRDGSNVGIQSGDRVRVVSPWGAAELEALVTPNMSPGVLGAAGGFGHCRGLEGDGRFPKMGGVNVTGRLLKPNYTEPMGGTPPLKYIKCRLEKVES
jgi:thiosulfate reductase/polysulfide reductase chain A